MASLLFLASPVRADLDSDGTIYRSAKHGIKLAIPEGWTPSVQTGYPSLLLLLTAPQRQATIIVAAGALLAGKRLQNHVAENLRGMEAVGFRLRSSRAITTGKRPTWEVLATDPRGMEIRQIYLTSGALVVILTLRAPQGAGARLAFDLRHLLDSLELIAPEPG